MFWTLKKVNVLYEEIANVLDVENVNGCGKKKNVLDIELMDIDKVNVLYIKRREWFGHRKGFGQCNSHRTSECFAH